jgi:hypothetical protein
MYHPHHLVNRFLGLIQIRWNAFINIAVEHGLNPEKFSIVTEAEKKRWDGESFRGILEVDMRFYCGAVERKEDPRKYHKFAKG